MNNGFSLSSESLGEPDSQWDLEPQLTHPVLMQKLQRHYIIKIIFIIKNKNKRGSGLKPSPQIFP